MRFLFLIFAGMAAAVAQQPRPDVLCSVSGRVVRADTGEALKRAIITIRPAEFRKADPASVVTGSDGHFEISGIRPGQYRILAVRNGFLSQEYGQRTAGRPGTPVTLQAGQEMTGVEFRLVQAGAISGRVVDEDGERMAYVHVQAFRMSRVQGRRQWSPVGMSNTNDLGEYRIFGLSPGRYYLAAQYTSSVPRRTELATEESYAPLYYPGSLDPSRAAPVELSPGGEMRGIDFNLVPTRAVRIRGRVKLEGTEGGSRPFLNLFPRTSAFLGFMGRHSSSVDDKGEFELRGVTPGSYWLSADLMDPVKRQSSRIPLEVGSTNIEGVSIVLGPAPELSGRLLASEGVNVSLGSIRIILHSAESVSSPSGLAVVKPDGSFRIEGVTSDVYGLGLVGLPEDVYIKAIHLGEADVTETNLDLTQGVPGPLEILLAGGTAQLTGNVSLEQQAAPGAIVVLVPEGDRRKLSRYFKTAVADQAGKFLVKDITPGDYKVFAWDELEEGVYQDPEYLQMFESKGKPVSLRPQARETVQLDLLNAAVGNR